jgi:hypothetical protein
LIGHWALVIPPSGFVIDSGFWFRHSGFAARFGHWGLAIGDSAPIPA